MNDSNLVLSTSVQLGTLQAGSPKELVSSATEMAQTLAGVIRSNKLAIKIGGREYVKVEGWTTLGAMMGVLAREVHTEERPDGSFLATVELVRMQDGSVLTQASAQCSPVDEPLWSKRPSFALRSMAQTRATGKACRLAFSWIMALAGYEATPAEEMSGAIAAQREPHPIQQPRSTAPAQAQGGATGEAAGTHSPPPVHMGETVLITVPQSKLIYAKLHQAGITLDEFCKEFGIEKVPQLPRDLINGALEWIQGMTPVAGTVPPPAE